MVAVIVLVGEVLAVNVGKGVLEAVAVNVRVIVDVEVRVGVFVGGFPTTANRPEVFQVGPTNN
jgi:hypothetical protein